MSRLSRCGNFEGSESRWRTRLETSARGGKIKLINQLNDDDKQTVFKIIDTMLTKQKFKDFFNKNVATL